MSLTSSSAGALPELPSNGMTSTNQRILTQEMHATGCNRSHNLSQADSNTPTWNEQGYVIPTEQIRGGVQDRHQDKV